MLFVIGLFVIFVFIFIGVIYGVILGYFGGWFDFVMMCVVDVFYLLLFIFFVIMLVVFFGCNFVLMFLVVGVVEWFDMVCIVCG